MFICWEDTGSLDYKYTLKTPVHGNTAIPLSDNK